jgi:hypothetical protein
MALGFSIVKALPKGMPFRWRVVDITMDTDYPSGGWPLAASDFKLNGIIAVLPCGQEDGYVPVWDRSASKLVMYEAGADGAALDECAVGEDALTSKIVTCLVVGY